MAKRYRRMRRYSPRRHYRRFRRGKAPLPLLPVLGGVVSPMFQSFNAVGGLSTLQSNPIEFSRAMLDQIGQRYTGVSFFPDLSGMQPGQINFSYLANTYGGLIAGVIGHKLANKFGVNRAMKKVPMIGKWVQL